MLIFYFFIVALTYSQTETYLLRLNDSEIQRYKGNTTLIRIGKSPFYAIQSSESPNFGSVISKNNSYRLSNWYSDKIQAAAAHAVTRGHSSTIVAIIDSGTDLDLTQFQSSYWINPAEDINSNQKLDSLDLNGIDDDGNGIIDDVIGYDFVDNGFENQFFDFNEIDPFPADDFPQSGHGTPIVDIIRQLAPEVKLMILKAADANGLLQELAIARSIIYAQENGAKVINMSFGNTIESAFLRSVIDYVTDFGVICVASSGNEGSSQVHFPAAFQSVIAVGNSNRFDERSASSNYGDALDLVAPGTEIPVTGRFGQFYTVSGTSFSAPMVSAAAALVLDVIDLDPAAMKHHLKLSSDDISLSGYDRFTGAGRLNLNKSVHQISHNQIRVISPADHSFYSDQFVPLRIDANGTHIETVELSVYSNTKIVYKNDWKDRQFYGDSLFNVNMLNLSEGEYTIELAVSGFQSNTLITRTKFTVDRSPVSISGKSSGPILNKEQLNFYIEYTVSEDVSISFRTLPNLYEFSQFNNSNRFNNRVFLEVPFTDLAGQNQLVVTLSDRANNQLKDTLAIPTQLGYYQKPFEYRLTNLKKARSVVSEIHTDLDHDNRPEFWLSRYQIGLKIDSTFVIEQQPDLSFKTVAAYQIQSVLRDQIDTNNDGLFQLLFGYADQANIVNQDGGFQLSSSASLSGAGIGTTFIQSSEPLVALRTATRYNLYNIHLLKIPTELTNFSTDPNFLDIPKLVQSQNSLFFADKNGNILWYNRNTFDPDTVLNSTYPEGSHSLFRIDRDLFYTGALVPNL
ncbi:MAG: S8 family serine peptidase, partial [Calditrichaeota bacterium]|nr:S8 family serine peptidase [Calditrichota bacterium]